MTGSKIQCDGFIVVIMVERRNTVWGILGYPYKSSYVSASCLLCIARNETLLSPLSCFEIWNGFMKKAMSFIPWFEEMALDLAEYRALSLMRKIEKWLSEKSMVYH